MQETEPTSAPLSTCIFNIASKALPSEGKLSASSLLTFGKERMKIDGVAWGCALITYSSLFSNLTVKSNSDCKQLEETRKVS